jgi:hypothetical protein
MRQPASGLRAKAKKGWDFSFPFTVAVETAVAPPDAGE